MVEAAVRTLVGEDKIAKNVNADEAAVMGKTRDSPTPCYKVTRLTDTSSSS